MERFVHIHVHIDWTISRYSFNGNGKYCAHSQIERIVDLRKWKESFTFVNRKNRLHWSMESIVHIGQWKESFTFTMLQKEGSNPEHSLYHFLPNINQVLKQKKTSFCPCDTWLISYLTLSWPPQYSEHIHGTWSYFEFHFGMFIYLSK